MLAGLAHWIAHHRRLVIGVWVVLTLFGAFSASQVSKRWFESFSIPGYSAYEANQRTLKTFGTGEQAPLVAVFRSKGDVTKAAGIEKAIAAAAHVNPGSRVSSYWSTGSRAYVSKDGHTAFAEIYPPGTPGFSSNTHIKASRAALKKSTPAGVDAYLTGRDPLQEAASGGKGPSVLTEALIGGLGSLVILFFVFGTLPAVAMPLVIAVASILNTFTLVWLLTYVTNVSIIVQFLIALVGLGVAIDYALLMIFRFRDELREGEDVETALVETMTHAGRSVIVSGSTVAVGLLSLIILPLPFIRSLGMMKPFVVLVEHGADPGPVAAKLRATPGIAGAVAPAAWRKGGSSLVEAFPAEDGASKATRTTISAVRSDLKGTDATLGGVAAEDRDFVRAVYSNFPYVLGFVILLTYLLLARAFRSLVLPLKAVVLNLVSLGAAYGIIVFIFQQGHGSMAIWNVHATQSIIPWIPLMIFAFLFGLSMDYEVFMLTRMREAYDETGDTRRAVALGLARTGKLVTSAALVLMFAFFVLSTSPGVDVKQF